MMPFLKFILIAFLFFGFEVNSQEVQKSPFRLGLKVGTGFMITHSPVMEYVSEQHFNKSEFYIEKRLNGSKDWHKRYNFPYAGLSLAYFNFDKEDYFGKAYSIAPYYSFYLFTNKNFELIIRPSVGAGWIEEDFDIESNHKNVAIGSNLNIYVSLLAQLNWSPIEHWSFTTGINYSHFSNTGFSTPNLGINLPSIEFGLIHQFGSNAEINHEIKEETEKRKEQFFQFRLGCGVNENYPVGGPSFLATAFSVEWEKFISMKSNFGAGLDLFYNPAQKSKLARDSIYINSGWQNLQMGISVHYLIKFGKISGGIKSGFYFKKEDEDLNSLYQEVYGQFAINNRISALLSLKTHLSTAEYLMIGLKYSLR